MTTRESIDEDLVTVDACAHAHEAHLLRMELESNDIAAYVEDEHILHMSSWLTTAVGGIKVRVASGDAARAREVVRQFRKGEAEAEGGQEADWGVCPTCGSGNVSPVLKRRVPLLIAIALVLLFRWPDLAKKKLKCRQCGHTWRYHSEKRGHKMIAHTLSACIVTEKVEESREFYVKHFGAKVTFDCGWYVNLEFGRATSTLQFMAPRDPGPPVCNPAGLTYNFSVADVDEEYNRLVGEGLTPAMPLEDHPWGDRAFAVLDPNGVTLYIYSDRDPTDEFRPFFRD